MALRDGTSAKARGIPDDLADSRIIQVISKLCSCLNQTGPPNDLISLLDALLGTCPFLSRSEFQEMEREKGENWHRFHRIYTYMQLSGCTNRLCRLLEEQQQEVGVVVRCIFILWHLSRNEQNRKEMLRLGTHRTSVELMDVHSEQLDFLVHALGLLWNLSAESDYRSDIIASHAPDKILALMHKHEEVAPLQENAIGALINLSLSIDFERCRRYVSPLLAAMSRHTSSSLIQENSCWFFCNMNDDSIRSYIIELGGVDCILRCLRLHEKDARVQEKGLWALCSFACDAPSSLFIVESGGLGVIVRAMRRFAVNETVVTYACWTLKNVAAASSGVCVDIAREDVVSLVLELMRAGGGCKRGGRRVWSEDAWEKYCGLLHNLAFNEEVRVEIIKKKGISRILKSLPYLHAPDPKASALAALCNLVKQEDRSINEFVRRKGIEAVLELMASESLVEIHKFGCILLYSLSRASQSCKLRIIRGGGVEAIKEAIKQHGQEQTIRDCAAQTLRNLCYNNKMEMQIQQETTVLLARASHPLQACLLP